MDSSQRHFFYLIIFCATFFFFIQENQIIQAHEIANINHHHYGTPTNVTKTLCFPNFTPSTTAHQLKLLGNARVSHQNGVVQIPYASSPAVDLTYQVGRAIYSSPIRLFDPLTKTPASFQTTFSFQLNTTTNTAGPKTHSSGGGGLAFVIVPDEFTVGRPGPWLGILNDACNLYNAFAVEFDSSHDPKFGDPNDDHVCINAGSAVSFKTAILPSSEARVSLHDNSVHRAWINYDQKNRWIDVFLGLDGDPIPQKPILYSALNLSPFLQEYMFVGFSASTGNSFQIHNILSWNFSSVSQAFLRSRTAKICHRNLARQVLKYSFMKAYYDPPSSFTIFVSVLGLFLLGWLCFYLSSKPRQSTTLSTYDVDNVFLEQKRRPRPPSKPRRFSLLELSQATRRFSQVEALASNSSGVLYRGTLRNGCRLGVKSLRTSQLQHSASWSRLEYGGRVLKRIGELIRVSHPSLAPIRGWCCDSAATIVVYNYYVNGSVERWLFGLGTIPWTRRVKFINDVGKALSYLHSKELVHGNVNTSSVFVDLNYETVLGDYGFVFSRGHDKSTFVGKKQDVFEFGMLVLEIVAGKKTVDFDDSGGDHDHEMGLLEFALRMEEIGEMVKVVDERVMGMNCADSEEAVRFVEIGLSCCTSEINRRPSMDEVVQLLNTIQLSPNHQRVDWST